MKINEYVSNRYDQLQEEIDLFNDMGITPVKKLNGMLSSCRSAINDLKAKITIVDFADIEEEICFFKYLKPKFLACQFYALEKYGLEANKPLTDNIGLRTYFENELKLIEAFFHKNQFMYHYYRMDGFELDNLLFVRDISVTSVLLPETPGLDQVFSTKGDWLYARFMTLEQLQEDLIKCLSPPSEHKDQKLSLNWTGDKINLIEIAYGIYYTGQMNNGKADIKEITTWLENSLSIDLSQAYRMFVDIRRRKTVSYTKYLEQMAQTVQEHIEESFSYKRKRTK